MTLLNEVTKSVSKKDKFSKVVSKGIYTEDGRKIAGERSSKLTLDALNEDGTLIPLTWKEWKELDVKDTSSDSSKKQFIQSMLRKVSQFNHKVELNKSIRRNDSFNDIVDNFAQYGVKYTKAGLKV